MKGGKVNIVYPDLSYEIIGVLYEVYNQLGYGYQEKHYQKAIEVVLARRGIKYSPQSPYKVKFNGIIIGRYFIDFIIENKIVLEVKQGKFFSISDFKQVHGYLKATDYKLGILALFTNQGVKYKRILNIK